MNTTGWQAVAVTLGTLAALWQTTGHGGETSASDFKTRLEAEWMYEATSARQEEGVTGPGPVPTSADAAGGCDGVINGQYGFHTGQAKDPWWQVDLGRAEPLDRVVVWNRCDGASERARELRVLLSEDGQRWRAVFTNRGSVFYGFPDNRPLTIPLAGQSGRWVRLQVPGTTFLHLDEVQVFGRAEPGRNLALDRPADQVSVSQWSREHRLSSAPPDWAARTAETLAHCTRLLEELAAGGVDVAAETAQTRRLAERLKARAPDAVEADLYLEARRVQRRLVLANPLLDFEAILFTQRVPASFNHMSDQYYGWWSEPGGGIYLLRQYKTDHPTVECLTGAFKEPGSFLRPTLSYDSQKVLFAWCRHVPGLAAEKNKLNKDNVPEDAFYHLYEMNLDGTGLRRLTRGKYDNFDGRYLPDGRIVFLSTRRGQFVQAGRESARQTLARKDLPDCYVRCGGDAERPVAVYTLHTMDADGGNLCAISPFEMFEWTPEVGQDGSILYSRWDYIDRDNMPYMGLWSIRPDGSNARLVYGNFTQSPHCAFEPQPVPNSRKIVFTASAHHAQTKGSLVLLDPAAGTEGKAPITRLTPEVPFPEIEGWPLTHYAGPWPLSERFYLVSWGREGARVPGPPGWNRWHAVRRPADGMALYLFDASLGRELLYSAPDISCGEPIPVRPRPKPPTLAEVADWNAPAEGRFLLTDVYNGLQTVPVGAIKSLRIIAVPPKTHPVMNSPNLGVTRDDPGKCVLGTVPVEADGSAYFRVPAGVIVFFQALDARGRAVQTMRSVTHVQPGQTLSCAGCHDSRHETPPAERRPPLAARREPSRITVGPDGSWPLRFDRLVQPVLDRHCVSCHRPEAEDKLAARFDLTPARAYDTLVRYGKPSLHERVWAGYRRGYSIEGEGLARGDALLALLEQPEGHHRVKLDEAALERLVVWMDAYAQRIGSFSEEQEQMLEALRQSSRALLLERTPTASASHRAAAFVGTPLWARGGE